MQDLENSLNEEQELYQPPRRNPSNYFIAGMYCTLAIAATYCLTDTITKPDIDSAQALTNGGFALAAGVNTLFYCIKDYLYEN